VIVFDYERIRVNPFSLLSEVGEDLQGAIQMVPPEKLGALKKREGVTPLSRNVLEESFAALIRDPGAILFTPGGGQFSLAGAQRKKALYLVNGRWYEPRGRTPSTHILKPPITGLAGQVENEMFCVRLAPRLGLPAPKCWVEVQSPPLKMRRLIFEENGVMDPITQLCLLNSIAKRHRAVSTCIAVVRLTTLTVIRISYALVVGILRTVSPRPPRLHRISTLNQSGSILTAASA
jgi:HipA-like C-terminal domain